MGILGKWNDLSWSEGLGFEPWSVSWGVQHFSLSCTWTKILRWSADHMLCDMKQWWLHLNRICWRPLARCQVDRVQSKGHGFEPLNESCIEVSDKLLIPYYPCALLKLLIPYYPCAPSSDCYLVKLNCEWLKLPGYLYDVCRAYLILSWEM